MLSALIVTLLTSSPAREPVKLAMVGFSGLNASEATLTYYAEHLAQQFRLNGVRVITGSEIGAVVGLERQKQLLGCTDSDSSCLTELANALGADGLLTGSLGQFGESWQLDVKVLGAADAQTLSVRSQRVRGDEALLDELSLTAQLMSAELARKLGRPGAASIEAAAEPGPAAAEELRRPSFARRWWWAPTAAGALCVGAGGLGLIRAQGALDDLRSSKPLDNPAAIAARGKTDQGGGALLVSVGLAALGTGAAMYLLGKPGAAVAPTVTVGPGAVGLGMTGSWR